MWVDGCMGTFESGCMHGIKKNGYNGISKGDEDMERLVGVVRENGLEMGMEDTW